YFAYILLSSYGSFSPCKLNPPSAANASKPKQSFSQPIPRYSCVFLTAFPLASSSAVVSLTSAPDGNCCCCFSRRGSCGGGGESAARKAAAVGGVFGGERLEADMRESPLSGGVVSGGSSRSVGG